MAREPRDRGLAERVDLGDEPLLGLGQRRFAGARGENVGGRERAGAAEAAVEMHALDPQAGTCRNRKTRRRAQPSDCAANTATWRGPPDRARPGRQASRGDGSAGRRGRGRRSAGARRAGRGRGSWCGARASTSETAARRRNRWRRRPAWSGGRPPSASSVASAPVRASRISRLASATASAWASCRVGRSVRHGGLEASGGSRRQEARAAERVKGHVRRSPKAPRSRRWPTHPTSW